MADNVSQDSLSVRRAMSTRTALAGAAAYPERVMNAQKMGRCGLNRSCTERVADGESCRQNSDCQSEFFSGGECAVSQQSPEELLRQLDICARALARVFPVNVINRVANPLTSNDIISGNSAVGWTRTGDGFADWQQNQRFPTTSVEFLISEYEIVASDADTGRYTVSEEVLNIVARSAAIPFEDIILQPTVEEGVWGRNALRRGVGGCVPNPGLFGWAWP